MLSFLLALTSCNNKAILFAGSRGWINYRHQADIWALYQDLIKRGFQKEDIIISCYDDIANHPQNPFKGKIFHELDHKENIYGGKEILNYKNYITAEMFYDSLRNLETTEEDNIFIYFDDHGGKGFLVAPIFEDGALYADDIAKVLIEMHDKKKCKNCIFFIEACEAGSVAYPINEKFKEQNVNNFAIITASDAHENSRSDLYDQWMHISLSNEFSSNFLDKIRETPDCTISELFDYLLSHKKSSTPVYYGDESIKSLKISDFIGTTAPVKTKKIRSDHSDNRHFTKFEFEKKRKSIFDQEKKEQHGTIKPLDTIIDEMAEKLIKFVNASAAQVIDDTITDEYFVVLKHFFKKHGVVPSDSSKITNFLLKMSHLIPVEKIIDVIDEVL
ncbi:hypothetical protein M9Y10_028949 [Tritrichomonas musculus]|uniref:Clan CD, family C13, asparaginyl endopeptidase-like cysteine peptidase n=1 Tax=Tritrichomonas musculus TaxID=1915356 RepID=A0ABR2KKQ3_9EUKA